MFEIVAHRGFWAGNIKRQNTKEAFWKSSCFGVCNEVDLRYSQELKKTYISHDKIANPVYFLNGASELTMLQTIFFHIKDNELEILEELKQTVNPKLPMRFFGLTEEGKEEYAKVFGWDNICYELEIGRKGKVVDAAISNCGIVWIVEFEEEISESALYLLRQKTLYWATPELAGKPFDNVRERLKFFDGVCTDFPDVIRHYLNFTK